ncbi:bifunctional diguanylate cyclase/phosphodiesterase [Roseomonas sp. 18066]|uniref:putative bifunctional diguanylate cyclase/phosphodiesterase n=1 Tax=Roseomonas sp. 18066 TaxID=2681412 RepID=UPI0013591C25|nr:EAL domain-containing protein [Roseomonas sp. 18066]
MADAGPGPAIDQETPRDAPAGFDAACLPLDRLTTPLWVYDIDHGRVVWANAAALLLWQAASREELAARDLGRELSASVARKLRQYQEDFIACDASFVEVWTLYPNGRPRPVTAAYRGLRLADGRMGMLCEALGDVEARADTLRSAEALVHTSVMIALYDHEGELLYRNPAARAVLPPGQANFTARFVDAAARDTLCAALEQAGEARMVAQLRTARGPRWHDMTLRRCRDSATGRPALLVSEVDISELKEAERKADYLATHDTLTGLPNRASLHPLFARLRGRALEEGGGIALLFIDLDGFKHVNDVFGHPVGDRLLVVVAQRLRACLRAGDGVIRLGGDEFLLLIRLPPDAGLAGGPQAGIDALAGRLREALSQPIQLAEHRLQVTPSIGISLYPEHATEVDLLAQQADLALYEAKAAGRNAWRYFLPEMDQRARDRLALEEQLRAALQQEEFFLLFQPRLSVQEGRVLGAQAVLRWRHPQRGPVDPEDFLRVCAEPGLLDPLGQWMLLAAARQQARWAAQGFGAVLAVKLYPRLFRAADGLALLQRILDESGCDPRRLELEVTEAMLAAEPPELVRARLIELRGMGFRLAVEGFGSGPASPVALRSFPLDRLKLAPAGLPADAAGLVASLGRLLGVPMLAEGVESLVQLEWLRAEGIDDYQGELCSPPLPAGEMAALLRADREWVLPVESPGEGVLGRLGE